MRNKIKVKEEKWFLHKEVKQVTPLRYCPGSLAVEQCLCSWSDPIEVLSRLAGKGATLEMKLKLWQFILLVHQYTPHPQSKQLSWLGLVCVLSIKRMVGTTSLTQASEEAMTIKELNHTSGRVRLALHETRSIQRAGVLPVCRQCCSGYNHPPKFFLCFVLEPPS